jgi:hypothetical protein
MVNFAHKKVLKHCLLAGKSCQVQTLYWLFCLFIREEGKKFNKIDYWWLLAVPFALLILVSDEGKKFIIRSLSNKS